VLGLSQHLFVFHENSEIELQKVEFRLYFYIMQKTILYFSYKIDFLPNKKYNMET